MINEKNEIFPLSKTKKIKGNRHILRQKILQILASCEVADIPWTGIFDHIFFRDFNFGDEEEKSERLLTPAEIEELESDTPIVWKNEEVEFAKMIIENCYLLRDDINRRLKEIVENWEIDRMAIIDKTIIHIAATELIKAELVPVKVTINEALELAKSYSTEKSSTFINGVIDKIVTAFTADGLINKTGKGLL